MTARVVILADGGYQGNLDLLGQHISTAPAKLKQRGASTGMGNGLRMARALGAASTRLGYFYGHTLAREAMTNDAVWPYPQIDELCIAGLVVNAAGERFVDEGLGGVTVANAIAKLADPLGAWAIFDDAMWRDAGCLGVIPANPHLLSAGGTLHQANTIDALAHGAGISPAVLHNTVQEYSQAAAEGRTSLLMPVRTQRARTAKPLTQPPFYAIPLCSGITYTFGGIAIDEHARVVRADGHPIAGLYAVGTTSGGLEGAKNCGYVGGLINGLAFGLRATEHIAANRL